MCDKATQLRLIINANPELDEEASEQLTRQLREEILDLGIEGVNFAKAGEAPIGSKAGGSVNWGTLVVTLAASGGVFTTLVNLLKSWLARNQQRSITLELDGDRLEVTGLSSKEQQRLIDEWMSRHKLVLTLNG